MEAIQFGSRKQCSIWELETLPACSTINLAVLLCIIAKELAQLLQLLIKDKKKKQQGPFGVPPHFGVSLCHKI